MQWTIGQIYVWALLASWFLVGKCWLETCKTANCIPSELPNLQTEAHPPPQSDPSQIWISLLLFTPTFLILPGDLWTDKTLIQRLLGLMPHLHQVHCGSQWSFVVLLWEGKWRGWKGGISICIEHFSWLTKDGEKQFVVYLKRTLPWRGAWSQQYEGF